MTILKNYINGQWVESKSLNVMDVINPATGLSIAKVPFGCREDIQIAAQAAKDASLAWRNTPAHPAKNGISTPSRSTYWFLRNSTSACPAVLR